MLEEGESTTRLKDSSFGHTADKVIFLSDAIYVEVTAQTSTLVKKRDFDSSKRKNTGDHPLELSARGHWRGK